MSAPVREPDDGSSKDGPLSYAPKKARHPEPDPNPAGAPGKEEAALPRPGPEPAEPPWKRSKQRTVFAGDAAIAELRGKLALAPDRLPDPPRPLRPARNTCWRAGLEASPWWRPLVSLATGWVLLRQVRRRAHSRPASLISRHWRQNSRSLMLPSRRSPHRPWPRMRSCRRPINKSRAILHRLEPYPGSLRSLQYGRSRPTKPRG